MVADIAEAQLGLLAHQRADQLVNAAAGIGARAVAAWQIHPQQPACRHIHRGFLQLSRRHFTKTLEAADLDLATPVEPG